MATMTTPNLQKAKQRMQGGGQQQRQPQGRTTPIRNMNPLGQYQSPGGYGKQPTEAPWSGARDASGAPRIKGVTSLDSARIMNDYEHGKGTSQAQAELAQDQQTAHQSMRSMAFEKGYEGARRKMGFGVQDTPPPADPVAARRKNLIAGGLQPGEVDTAMKQEAAAKTSAGASPAPVAPPAAAPVPGAVKPPAPVVPPAPPSSNDAAPSTIGDNGQTGTMSDWLANNKARQMNPANIGPQGAPVGGGPPAPDSDAARLAGATEHANDIKAANMPPAPKDDDDTIPRMKGGPVNAAKTKMCRAMGGPVGGVPVGGVTDFTGTGTNSAQRADGRKKGGPVKREDGGPVIMPSNIPGIGVAARIPRKAYGAYPTAPTVQPIPSSSRKGQTQMPAFNGSFGAMSGMKKGGPVKTPTNKTYKIAEKGPELFMSNRKDTPPQVIGANGPEVGQFSEDGVVIPNHALNAMKRKFSKMPTDNDGDNAEPDDDADDSKPATKAKLAMRPQAP